MSHTARHCTLTTSVTGYAGMLLGAVRGRSCEHAGHNIQVLCQLQLSGAPDADSILYACAAQKHVMDCIILCRIAAVNSKALAEAAPACCADRTGTLILQHILKSCTACKVMPHAACGLNSGLEYQFQTAVLGLH